MEALKVELFLTPEGTGKIKLEGIDISNAVRNVKVSSDIQEATIVTLEFFAEVNPVK